MISSRARIVIINTFFVLLSYVIKLKSFSANVKNAFNQFRDIVSPMNTKSLARALILSIIISLLLHLNVLAQISNQTAYYPPASVPSWLDTGSNAWMLTAATLVGIMSIPALALYYAGLTKKKYVVNTILMVFYSFAVVLIIWVLLGYSLAFGHPGISIDGYGILGYPSPVWLGRVEASQTIYGPNGALVNIPLSTFIFFQFTFAAITPGLIAGAVLERMNFKAWMVFVPLWSLLVYSPVAYWLFAGGWLNQLGAVDFSGGYIIHIDAGFAALAAAYAVGPRLATERKLEAHNLPLVLLGTGLLWLGWDGFNGGDPYGATIDAAIAVLNTNITAAVGAIVWMLMDMKYFGKLTLIGATTGGIVGAAAITPAAGYVNGWESIVIGLISVPIAWVFLNILEPKLKADDALGIFSTHGMSSVASGILTGIFADPTVSQYVDPGLTGALYGNLHQLLVQSLAVAIVAGYSFTLTYVLLKIIGLFVPLQAPPQDLAIGDYAMHGEVAYSELLATLPETKEVIKEEEKEKDDEQI